MAQRTLIEFLPEKKIRINGDAEVTDSLTLAGKDVGTALNNADSTATSLASHIANVSNPHAVTKAQVGLANADNTSDVDKPISTVTQAALDAKVETKPDGSNVLLSNNKLNPVYIPDYLLG